MKIFATLEPHAALPGVERHPPEDYYRISDTYPIFVVADGVTLIPGPDGVYPDPSGAGEVARIFCDAVIEEAEYVYDQLSADMLTRLFRAGNAAVAAYNRKHGRNRDTINFLDQDMFAATAAFAAVVKDRLYWFSIADAGVATIASTNMRPLSSTELLKNVEFPETWGSMSSLERRKHMHSTHRNASHGRGYGVVTGESEAEQYLQHGIAHLRPETRVILFSDGFENHLRESEFITLVDVWPHDFEDAFRSLDKELVREQPATYGRERTIIAVRH